MEINLFSRQTRMGSAEVVLVLGAAIIVALVSALLLGAESAQAAGTTFTVNSTGDENDLDFPGGTPGVSSDGKCDVSSAAGDQCTLRAAIQNANQHSGADTIAFNIPGIGVHTISPDPELPNITQQVTIDGYTQGDATADPADDAKENTIDLAKDGTDATLKIELDGNSAGSVPGLQIDSGSNSVIRGLAINDFDWGIILNNGTGHKIQGNFLGTNPSGTVAEGNLEMGILVKTSNSTIGGASSADRNLISGNSGFGIWVASSQRSSPDGNNKIQGNLIGTQADGISPLGNGSFGVAVDTPSNTIGGSDPNAANAIAFNTDQGVILPIFDISEAGVNGNRILSNSIYSNGRLGIDLAGGTEDANGVTTNDDTNKDSDTGPNRLQNYPVLDSPLLPGGTTISGKLNSTPSTRKKKRTFTIQFFSSPENPLCFGKNDCSGYGEGKTFLGQIPVTTNRKGTATFFFFTKPLTTGQVITATATNKKTGDTSEFSQARVVKQPVIGGG